MGVSVSLLLWLLHGWVFQGSQCVYGPKGWNLVKTETRFVQDEWFNSLDDSMLPGAGNCLLIFQPPEHFTLLLTTLFHLNYSRSFLFELLRKRIPGWLHKFKFSPIFAYLCLGLTSKYCPWLLSCTIQCLLISHSLYVMACWLGMAMLLFLTQASFHER